MCIQLGWLMDAELGKENITFFRHRRDHVPLLEGGEQLTMSLGWSLRAGFTSWPHSLGRLPRPQHTRENVATLALCPVCLSRGLPGFHVTLGS